MWGEVGGVGVKGVHFVRAVVAGIVSVAGLLSSEFESLPLKPGSPGNRRES